MDPPTSEIRFEPSTVQKFNNAVLNTAGHVEPYSQERPMHSSLANSSAAGTNPVTSYSSSYAPSSQFPASDDTIQQKQELAGNDSSSSSGGFFDRLKDKVSDLMHGHEDADKDSAFPAQSDVRVEPSDSSNASSGGSWLSKDHSHVDNGSLPFALDKDVDKHRDSESTKNFATSDIITRDSSKDSSIKDSINDSMESAKDTLASAKDSIVDAFADPSSSSTTSSTVAAVPHPAAENTSDFSFWQPPADAPVDKGGFSTTSTDSDLLAAKANVSETARHAATWEGK